MSLQILTDIHSASQSQLGNTCYANSVLQALYFCQPFRDIILSYAVQETPASANTTRPATATTISDGRAPPFGDGQDQVVGPSKLSKEGHHASDFQVSDDPETLFVTLHRLFASIAKASAEHAPPSPTTPTRTTSSRGISIPGKGGKAANTKTKQPTRPSTASGMSRPAVSPSGNQPQVYPLQNASGIKRKDQGVSAGPVDQEVLSGFLAALRRENILFKSREHQDAHEFLNFVLNAIAENLEEIDKKRLDTQQTPTHAVSPVLRRPAMTSSAIQRLFQGTLTNETRCLTCEAITSRDESFLDLSIDLEHNTSVTACLRQFSASETLRARDKFFCDTCSGLQEAEKRMKIRKLPAVLALHLKRFKYEEAVNDYVKVAYRVVFPFQLRLFNTTEDADDPDRLYELFGIVIHIGIRPTQGHYVSIVKVGSKWAVFDDDAVHYIEQLDISKYFGDSPSMGSAYVLFYQSVDLDRQQLGLPEVTPEETKAKILPLAMANMAANPSVSTTAGTNQINGEPETAPSSNYLNVPTLASPSGSASPMSSISGGGGGSPSKPSILTPGSGSNSSNEAINQPSSSIWSRRRGNSNSLAQAAEQARQAADVAVSSSSHPKSAISGGKDGTASGSTSNSGGSLWRNPFGRSKERARRSASVSEPPGLPPVASKEAESPQMMSVDRFSGRRPLQAASQAPVKPSSTATGLPRGSDEFANGDVAYGGGEAAGWMSTEEGDMSASKESSAALQSSGVLPASDRRTEKQGTHDQQPSPTIGATSPSRPQRHPSRATRPDTATQENAVAAPETPANMVDADRSKDEANKHHVPRSPPMRSSTLPTQGAAFAPLDRPLTKKEQHKVAKHAAHRRGSLGVPAGSVSHDAGASDGVPQPTSPILAASSDAPLGQERRAPSTFAGRGEEVSAATDKSSRRRSTLSRAFGLGRKDKDKK